MAIGQATRELTKQAGLGQREIAAILGVDQGRVSLLLNARRGARLRADEVLAIENALGVRPGSILQRAAELQQAGLEEVALAAESGSARRDAGRLGHRTNRPSPAPGRDE